MERPGLWDSWKSQSVIEPREALRQLRGRHVHFMSEVEGQILALTHFGYTNDEVADVLGVTPATILYPAGGAGGAFNNTRNECKKLTPTGAVGC